MVFKGTDALNDIIINPENTHFVTDDDALFSTNRQELIYYYKSDFCDRYEIPASVTSIKGGAFAHKWMIWDIVLPDNLVTIGDQAFIECNNIINVSIPNTVTAIGNSAFKNCNSLGAITIPNSVETIETYAFMDCSALQTITVPNGVKSIEWGAFETCSQLTNVELPASLTNLEGRAFGGCKNLEEIKVMNPTPISIPQNTFEGVDKNICVLHVPNGTKTAYEQMLVWQDFLNIMDLITSSHHNSLLKPIIYSDNNQIVVIGADANSLITVYNVNGALIKTFNTNKNTHTIDVPIGNIYIVKVNGVNYKVVM